MGDIWGDTFFSRLEKSLLGSGSPIAQGLIIFQEYTTYFQNMGQSLTDIGSYVKKLFDADFPWLQDVLNMYCRPDHPDFWVRKLFIPSTEVFSDVKKNLQLMLDEKLPFISQMQELFNSFINAKYTENVPRFAINIPKYGIYDQAIIDFRYFTEYRYYITNFIRFSAWFFFLIKLYKRLPFLIDS